MLDWLRRIAAQKEKRPLQVGVVLAVIGLLLSLQWPPRPWHDVVWTALTFATAGCFLVQDRQLRARGVAWPALRWAAAMTVGVTVLWLLWART